MHTLLLLLFLVCLAKGCAPDNLPCKEGYTCYQGIGCVPLGDEAHLLDCHGVCINTRETPTLACHGLTACENGNVECPDIRDNDLCYTQPVLHNDGSCASRGVPIQCDDGLTCIEGSGCPVVAVALSTTTEQTDEEEEEEDKTGLITFFFLYGIALLSALFAIIVMLNR